MKAPPEVFESCMRGLAYVKRNGKTGATKASIGFATTVLNGFPLDPVQAVEIKDVHRDLDRADVAGDVPAKLLAVSRDLWGGDQAAQWAEQVLDKAAWAKPPERDIAEPIAAEASTARERAAELAPILDALFARATEIDQQTVSELEAAFWVWYQTALRRASAAASKAIHRVPKSVQAEAGFADDTLYKARDRHKAAHPFEGWQAVGEPVLAALGADLESSLRESLQDFQNAAERILRRGNRRQSNNVSEGLGASSDPERQALDSRSGFAAAFLSEGLFGWLRDRLSGSKAGEARDPADLNQVQVPTDLLNETLDVVNGAQPVGSPPPTRPSQRGSRATVGPSQPGQQRLSIGESMTRTVLQGIEKGEKSSTVVSPEDSYEIGVRYKFDYGTEKREQPFDPHVELHGKIRVGPPEFGSPFGFTDAERELDAWGKYYPEDHSKCGCKSIALTNVKEKETIDV